MVACFGNLSRTARTRGRIGFAERAKERSIDRLTPSGLRNPRKHMLTLDFTTDPLLAGDKVAKTARALDKGAECIMKLLFKSIYCLRTTRLLVQ